MNTKPRQRRIYLASSWRNTEQPRVLQALIEAGHDVYDFRHPWPGYEGFHWDELDPNYEHWSPGQYRSALQHPIAQKGFNADWHVMLSADTCVLLLPSGRSAHLEAGYFVGAEKELFILHTGVDLVPELMYKMAKDICLDIAHLLVAMDGRS